MKGGTDPGNLAIELSLRYHMFDSLSKFEEDMAKIVVTIVDEKFVRTHKDRPTDIWTYAGDFISVQMP